MPRINKRARDDSDDDGGDVRAPTRPRGRDRSIMTVDGRCFHCHMVDHKWQFCGRTCVHCSSTAHCETQRGRGDGRRCPVLDVHGPNIYGTFFKGQNLDRVFRTAQDGQAERDAQANREVQIDRSVHVAPNAQIERTVQTNREMQMSRPVQAPQQARSSQRTDANLRNRINEMTVAPTYHDRHTYDPTMEDLRQENASLQATIDRLETELREERNFRNLAVKQMYQDGWRDGEQSVLQQHRGGHEQGGAAATPALEARNVHRSQGPVDRQSEVRSGRFEDGGWVEPARREGSMRGAPNLVDRSGAYDERGYRAQAPSQYGGGDGQYSQSRGGRPGGYGSEDPRDQRGGRGSRDEGFQILGRGGDLFAGNRGRDERGRYNGPPGEQGRQGGQGGYSGR
ncbi:hypothetical protein LTR53_012024 [Teratosphaeriaceae sp. CCFEE 6253]|nr:hypothetical protein LTR53_012024 [Teratosphaeriaceae sp. CCFEE 6253]